MKQYKCIKILEDTEKELNKYAKQGWEVKCMNWVKWWFILEREEKKSK